MSDKRVHIKLFSYLREVTGHSDLQLDSEKIETVRDAVDHLERRYPEIGQMRSYLRYAVNQKYSKDDVAIAAGDEIAIISPVSGG